MLSRTSGVRMAHIADISPDPPRHGLLPGQQRHQALVAVQPLVAEHMGPDAILQWCQRWHRHLPTPSAFRRDDGRICLTNNAAERALRGIAVGRRNWTFAGSDRGADRAAALYTLIETARLNDRRSPRLARRRARPHQRPPSQGDRRPLALELESRKSGLTCMDLSPTARIFSRLGPPVAVMYTSFAGPWRFAACPGS